MKAGFLPLLLPLLDGSTPVIVHDPGSINSAHSFSLTRNCRGFQSIAIGSDRVSPGEVPFKVLPKPSAALLGLLGTLGRIRRR
jgi:hypothetical protein